MDNEELIPRIDLAIHEHVPHPEQQQNYFAAALQIITGQATVEDILATQGLSQDILNKIITAATHQEECPREFTDQELELRPHLSFLIRHKKDPNANSCIRLENIPNMFCTDQLANFLGVQLNEPCENIARMQNGVLYINLITEAMATKAVLKNAHFLNGNQITITQLNRSEMADAIRQNMIIIREMYRFSVVARGFPLTAQPQEVISLFERFNLDKDSVEKCAIQPMDKVSTFLLTFASTHDCLYAIRTLNNTKTMDGTDIQLFQPPGNHQQRDASASNSLESRSSSPTESWHSRLRQQQHRRRAISPTPRPPKKTKRGRKRSCSPTSCACSNMPEINSLAPPKKPIFKPKHCPLPHQHPDHIHLRNTDPVKYRRYFTGSVENWTNIEPYGSFNCKWCGFAEDYLLVKFEGFHEETPWTPIKQWKTDNLNLGWLLISAEDIMKETAHKEILKFFTGGEWSIKDFLVKHTLELYKKANEEQKSTVVTMIGPTRKIRDFNKALQIIRLHNINCHDPCWKCNILFQTTYTFS